MKLCGLVKRNTYRIKNNLEDFLFCGKDFFILKAAFDNSKGLRSTIHVIPISWELFYPSQGQQII